MGTTSEIPQEHAKKFVPPSAHIWKANLRGEWAGHYKPYKRVSAKWADWGEQKALVKVLRMLWNQYNEHNGKPLDTSPIKGLFAESGAELVAA